MKNIDAIIDDFERYGGKDNNLSRVIRTHLSLLLKWQKIVNLIGITSERDIAEFLYLDSFFVLKVATEFLRIKQIDIREVSDIGSGAGFPSLFWFYFLPNTKVLLFESKRKKANFLRELVKEAKLNNYEVREEMVKPEMLKTDMIISKATLNINDWPRFGVSNVKKGGIVVSLLTSSSLTIYNKALKRVSKVLESHIIEYKLPYNNIERYLGIIIKK